MNKSERSAISVRVVIDTNVFVTALLHGRTPRKVYEAFLSGALTPLLSPETLTELIDVLARPPLRGLMSSAEVGDFLALIQRDGLIIRPKHRIRVCRDPKDNALLECALAAEAEAIVRGDRYLLVLHPFHHIPILRPSDFLRLLS